MYWIWRTRIHRIILRWGYTFKFLYLDAGLRRIYSSTSVHVNTSLNFFFSVHNCTRESIPGVIVSLSNTLLLFVFTENNNAVHMCVCIYSLILIYATKINFETTTAIIYGSISYCLYYVIYYNTRFKILDTLSWSEYVDRKYSSNDLIIYRCSSLVQLIEVLFSRYCCKRM